jgi:hypothetical protein
VAAGVNGDASSAPAAAAIALSVKHAVIVILEIFIGLFVVKWTWASEWRTLTAKY